MADMESVKRKIEPASREELYEIAAFLDDCWRSAYSGIVSSDFLSAMKTDERYKKLLARFDEQISAFLVLRDKGVLIGVTVFGKSFTEDYLDDGEVSAIYLHPEYIGKGLGHQIMAQAEEALSAKGYDYFVLDVLSGNERAISFYKKQGYEIVAERSITLGDKDYPLTVFRKKNTLKKGDVPRIMLREWRIGDAPDLTAAINNKSVLDNLRDGIPYPYTEKDAVEFITATLSAEKDTQYAFAICINDKVIGSIGVFRRDNVHRYTAEMGYYIAEPYWGKGIMTEAVRQMCAYIFENTDIVRIFAEPYAHNSASCRVLEKAGFQFEGLLRQNAAKNGQSVDMRMYAIIKDGKEPVFQEFNIKSRLATLDDTDGVCLLNEEFWRYNAKMQPDYYRPAKDRGDFPKSVIESADSDLIIAIDGDKTVGLIHVRESKTLPFAPIVQHRYAEVVDFIVTASHRRMGIGVKLMDAAKEWSKARNLEYMELFVLSEATGEKLFYEKTGFKAASFNMRCEL